MKLTKAPKIDIKYGILQNEREWVNWVTENLSAINKNTSSFELINIASQLFNEISHCGYREGYDSACCDKEEE